MSYNNILKTYGFRRKAILLSMQWLNVLSQQYTELLMSGDQGLYCDFTITLTGQLKLNFWSHSVETFLVDIIIREFIYEEQ